MADKLTPKQAMFVKEYLVDLNATQAAIRAGYSKKTAEAIGLENLGKPRIQTEINKAIAERSERTEIKADDVLNRYENMAKANITDYMDVKTILIKIGETEDGEPIYEKRDEAILKDFSQLTRDQTYAIESIKYGRYGLEFKLADKKGANDSIAKHLGMFVEKHEHTGKDGGPIETRNLSDEELDARIARLMGKVSSDAGST